MNCSTIKIKEFEKWLRKNEFTFIGYSSNNHPIYKYCYKKCDETDGHVTINAHTTKGEIRPYNINEVKKIVENELKTKIKKDLLVQNIKENIKIL